MAQGSAEIAEGLREPFKANDIEWRAQSSGYTKSGKPYAILLAYVNNRAIQDRLDQVVGIEKWRNEFAPAPGGGVMCGISIKFDDWIPKWDGAENTDFEAVKGGLSGSMKRAAVQWGIGRYLYNLPTSIVMGSEKKADDSDLFVKVKRDKTDKYGTGFYFSRPRLPEWALPSVDAAIKKRKEQLMESPLKSPPTIVTQDVHSPSKDQLASIKGHLLQLGYKEDQRNEMLAGIKTYQSAEQSITNLREAIAKKRKEATEKEPVVVLEQ